MSNPRFRALILAAGRGRRMGELTAELPKPLVPVGGRPMLARIADRLTKAGASELAVVVGYRSQQIVEALEAWRSEERLPEKTVPDLRIIEQPSPRGTGDAVWQARAVLEEGPAVVTWGDILLPWEQYLAVWSAPLAGDAGALGINETNDPSSGAAVYLREDGTVRAMVEKPPVGSSSTCWNNAGLLRLNREVLTYLERCPPSARGEIELTTALNAMLEDGALFRGVVLSGWTHVGDQHELQAANRAFAEQTDA